MIDKFEGDFAFLSNFFYSPESVKVACDICCFVSEPIKTFIQEKGDKK